jgi:hypothetical protein
MDEWWIVRNSWGSCRRLGRHESSHTATSCPDTVQEHAPLGNKSRTSPLLFAYQKWVKVMLRLTVSRCQSLIWGPRTDLITVRQLRGCWCGTPFLTRGRVYHLQLLLALASTGILGSEYCGSHNHIILTQIETPPTWRARSPQEQGGPVTSPGTEFPFHRLLRHTWLRWRYSNPPPRGDFHTRND